MGCGGLCEGCALEKSGAGFTEVEIGSRYAAGRLLLVGEASGEAEARESLPFRPYAQSGSLLSDAMRAVGVGRGDVAITNVLRCRPPKDWLEGAPWQSNAIYNCSLRYLAPEIERLKPAAILALGGTAFRTLTTPPKGKYGVLDMYMRGYVVEGTGVAAGIPVIGSPHPAWIRRGQAHRTPHLHRDLRRAWLVAQGKLVRGQHWGYGPEDFTLRYQTSPSLDEAWEWARTVDPSLPIVWDCETRDSAKEDEDDRTSYGHTELVLAQFTQRRHEGIAIPYRDEYIEVVKYILGLPNDKVTHNGWAFDDMVAEAHGIKIEGDSIDAMCAFGFYWSDLPKNLQSAAQMAGYEFPWKHLGSDNLELYGCCDVDANLAEYQYIRRQLEQEGMWDSFMRYFARVWPILKSMARRGIPIDDTRRNELKALISREDTRVSAAIQQLVPREMLGWEPKAGLKRTPADTTGMVNVEIVVEKEEKCSCLKKARGACVQCAGTGIIPAGTTVRRWARPVEFNPNSSQQVKRFMKLMRHPVPKHAKRVDEQGEAAETTEMKELERLAIKTKHPIYPLLIEKRQLTKVEGTYADGWRPSADGAVHTTYTFQTATWQTSSRSPNVQNGLKHGKSEFQKQLAKSFNQMQRAKDGFVLVNFDFKSFHALTTAHDFNIPDYARLARIDIHSFVACQFLRLPECQGLWDRDDADMKALFKWLRQRKEFADCRDVPAKQTILGIQFGRGPMSIYTMYREFFDSLSQAKAIHALVYSLFPKLKTAQTQVVERAHEEQKLVNKFGAVRHFFDCRRWDRKQQKWVNGEQAEQAMAFLPASHAFGHLRDVLLRCEAQGWPERYGFCNQIHDSIVVHCPVELQAECIANVKGEMERPSTILIYPQMAPGGFQVDADAAVGESLAELK